MCGNWSGWLEVAAAMHNKEMHAKNGNIDTLTAVAGKYIREVRMGVGKAVLWDSPATTGSGGLSFSETSLFWNAHRLCALGCVEAGRVERVPVNVGTLLSPAGYVDVGEAVRDREDSDGERGGSAACGDSLNGGESAEGLVAGHLSSGPVPSAPPASEVLRRKEKPRRKVTIREKAGDGSSDGGSGSATSVVPSNDGGQPGSSGLSERGSVRDEVEQQAGGVGPAADQLNRTLRPVYFSGGGNLSRDELERAMENCVEQRIPTYWVGVGVESRRSHGVVHTTEQCERLILAGVQSDPPVPPVVNTAKAGFVYDQATCVTHVAALAGKVAAGPARDFRLMAVKCALYDDMVENRFTEGTGVDWAFSANTEPIVRVVRSRHGENNNMRCIFVGDDVVEIALRRGGDIPVEGEGEVWHLFDGRTTVIGLPDNDALHDAGVAAWIFSHLRYPLYERQELYEVRGPSEDWRRVYRFVRNSCLVDIYDRSDRIVFIVPTKNRERVWIGPREFRVLRTDYRYTLPPEFGAVIYDLNPTLDYLINQMYTRQSSFRQGFSSFSANFLTPGINWLEIETVVSCLVTRYYPRHEALRVDGDIMETGLPAQELERKGFLNSSWF